TGHAVSTTAELRERYWQMRTRDRRHRWRPTTTNERLPSWKTNDDDVVVVVLEGKQLGRGAPTTQLSGACSSPFSNARLIGLTITHRARQRRWGRSRHGHSALARST